MTKAIIRQRTMALMRIIQCINSIPATHLFRLAAAVMVDHVHAATENTIPMLFSEPKLPKYRSLLFLRLKRSLPSNLYVPKARLFRDHARDLCTDTTTQHIRLERHTLSRGHTVSMPHLIWRGMHRFTHHTIQ